MRPIAGEHPAPRIEPTVRHVVGERVSWQRIQRVLDDPAVLSMVFQPIVDLVTDEVASATIVRRPAATSGFANAAASLRSTQDC